MSMHKREINLPNGFTPQVTNCLLVPRSESEKLFYAVDDLVLASLEGYAVVPVEDYEALEDMLNQYYPGGVTKWRQDREGVTREDL